MTSPELSHAQRGKVRQLATLAYEREMARELNKLEHAFHAWRAGQLSVADLIDALDAFHEGPNKKLFVLYHESAPLAAVARAVAIGFLENHEVGADLIKSMAKQIEFFRQ